MKSTHVMMIKATIFAFIAILCSQYAMAQSATTKKWFPGHYLYADEKSFSIGLDATKASLVKNNPYFRGYHVRYSFANLEPRKNVYDFSLIARDINTARADGKKLIVHIHDRTHQNAERVPVPDYMTKEPIYEGGVYKVFADTAGTWKLMPKLWVPAYAERMGALMMALGRAFDNNDTLAYVAIEETSLNDTKSQPGFTSAKLRDSYITIYNAAAKAFPNTIFSQYANWRGGMTAEDADKIMANLVEVNKHGFGGPDALAALRPFDGVTSIGALENQFGVYYRKYKGVAPITASSQSPSYEANDALTNLNYAVNQLQANFLSWAPIEDGRKWDIYDAIRVVTAEKGRINTDRPSGSATGSGPPGSLPAPEGVLLQTQ